MNKIVVLVISLVFFSGCQALIKLTCDSRYEKKEDAPFFEDVQIAEPGAKAVVILYQPYYQACGTRRNNKITVAIFINGELAVTNLVKDHFTVLLVEPLKLDFSAVRTTKEQFMSTSTQKMGKLEIKPKAGEKYFARWSNELKHRRPGWIFNLNNQLQLVDKQTALKELQGVLYTAPPLYKAPVFDKKTGEAL